jgi:hypothetical protein
MMGAWSLSISNWLWVPGTSTLSTMPSNSIRSGETIFSFNISTFLSFTVFYCRHHAKALTACAVVAPFVVMSL